MFRATLRSFLYDDGSPAVVDLSCHPLPVDVELAARNERRIAEARERLGGHWICSRPINVVPTFRFCIYCGGPEHESDSPAGERCRDMQREQQLSAADLHPRLPAWMKAHAADEQADLDRRDFEARR